MVRELKPAVVRAFSRSGDDLGLALLPWPNIAPGDVLELDGGDVARVVDVVHAPAGSVDWIDNLPVSTSRRA